MWDDVERVDLETMDLATEYREAFSLFFPGVLTDGVLDVAKLTALLDVPATTVLDGRERYGIQWAGWQESVRTLLTPSRAALIPSIDRSIDFFAARNVMIEGDNLEVLKLLQKAYNDRIKLMYIDPPYNTGNDFVYDDDFSDGLRGYLRYTGQVDSEGNRISANADRSGRRHSRWLSMMYPRLVLARNLLTQDGVICISIDSNEFSNLKLILDDIFGPENFLNSFVWASNLKGRQIGEAGAVGTHEYILCYARNAREVGQFRGSQKALSALMPTVYKGPGYQVKEDERGPYVTKNELYNTNSRFNETTAPTMVFRIHYNPDTGEVRVSDIDDEETYPGFVTAMPHRNARTDQKWHAWRWSRAKVLKDYSELEFEVRGNELRIRTKIRDVDGTAIKDLIIGPSTVSGQADLKQIGLERIFETPKPVDLLQMLISATTAGSDMVLDFFAGSGSTAHAVALQNAEDGGDRRVISVNIPEETAKDSEARRAGLETVSAITLARLQWVTDNVQGADASGLKVLYLGESNFLTADTVEGELNLSPTTLREDAEAMAIAGEILLKEGVPLDSEWSEFQFHNVSVHVSGGVAVVVGEGLDVAVAEGVFELDPKPHVVVFLEDDLAGQDALKANLVANAKSRGITMKTV